MNAPTTNTKGKVSSKTLGDVVDEYRDALNIIHLDYSGTELVEEISKLRDEHWIFVEGLVAKFQKPCSDCPVKNTKTACPILCGAKLSPKEVLAKLDVKEQKKETE